MVMTLQFLVYGVHWGVRCIVGVGRMAKRGMGMVGKGSNKVVRAVRRHRTVELGGERGKNKFFCLSFVGYNPMTAR